MHYIVETREQLRKLSIGDKCYLEVIPASNNYHPGLTTASLVYIRTAYKGYILPVKHSEAFSLDITDIASILTHCKEVYCLDAKYTSYFIDHPHLIDIMQVIVDTKNKLLEFNCNTQVHDDYYRTYPYLYNLNEIIPISKHYERCEALYENLQPFMQVPANIEFQRELAKQYKLVETVGLGLNGTAFAKHYEPAYLPYSSKGDRILTYYNLYNLTGRPTNAFNNINFLALNKEDHSRKAITPLNDIFVEFDFEGYHPRLIAKLIGYSFSLDTSIHTQLGQQYFNKEVLTEEEYAIAKSITFRQIYGAIREEYKHIPFFQKIEAFIDDLWDTYQYGGYITLPTGRVLYRSKNDLSPQKLFNYYVQNLETYQNVSILKKLNEYLAGKQSKITLVVYDSFLLDFCIQDGKDTLFKIKELLQEAGLTVKVKVGKDYDSLEKTGRI